MVNLSKLTLKEAGRYSNFLTERLANVYSLQYGSKFEDSMFKIEQKHLRTKSCKDAEDETISNREGKLDLVNLEKLEEVVTTLINEKERVSIAIEKAKESIEIHYEHSVNGLPLGIDSAVAQAKTLRQFADSYYTIFARAKEKESKANGRAYTFNEEGNQVAYSYDIEETKELDFEKKIYADKEKIVRASADDLSSQVDAAMSDKIVEFTPKYNYLDSLDDLLEV